MATREKECKRCGELKPESEFTTDRRRKNGLHSYCKACNSTRVCEYQRIRRYGVTPEMFAEMLEAQGGACAICGATETGDCYDWHVDHCHKTGKVRGLLCAGCNKGIGQMGDDPDRVLAAAFYLLSHQEVLTLEHS